MLLTKKERNNFNDFFNKLFDMLDFKPDNLEVYGSFIWSPSLPLTSGDVDMMEQVNLKDFDKWYNETFKPLIEDLKKGDVLLFNKLKINKKSYKTLNSIPTKKTVLKLIEEQEEIKNWVKFDLFFLYNGKVKETSIIYSFNKNKISKAENKAFLLEDILELYNEKKFYKMLKRLYVLAEMNNQKKIMDKIKGILLEPKLSGLYVAINNIMAMIALKNKPEILKDNSQLLIEDLRKIGFSQPRIKALLRKPTKENLTMLEKILNKHLNKLLVNVLF